MLLIAMEDILSTVPFSAPPSSDMKYEIGDHVEVLCDHDFEDDRVRDWLEGVVVKRGHKKPSANARGEKRNLMTCCTIDTSALM